MSREWEETKKLALKELETAKKNGADSGSVKRLKDFIENADEPGTKVDNTFKRYGAYL